jgi:hypothetical protein
MKSVPQPSISNISIHKINETAEIMFGRVPNLLMEGTENHILARVLLKGFNRDAPYRFSKQKNGEIPALENIVNELSGNKDEFINFSMGIAREWAANYHDEPGEHDLILCQFLNIQTGDEINTAYGIFYIDTLEKFLQVIRTNNEISIQLNEGINLKKINDCALMIPGLNGKPAELFFKQPDYGYKKDLFTYRFLKATPVHNNFYNTASHLDILKAYVDHELEDEAPLDKIEKISRSADYFTSHDHFDQNEYDTAIFEDSDHKAAFDRFREQYAMDNDIRIVDEFEISPTAVKKNFRRIRSVIKLDRNFHVYVHGNRENIIRGYDAERGKHFYQLFFDEEN